MPSTDSSSRWTPAGCGWPRFQDKCGWDAKWWEKKAWSQLDPVQIAALQFAEGKPGVGWFMEQGARQDAVRPDRILVPLRRRQGRSVGRRCPTRSSAGGWTKSKHGFPARRPRPGTVDQEDRRGRLAERRAQAAAGDHQLRGRHAQASPARCRSGRRAARPILRSTSRSNAKPQERAKTKAILQAGAMVALHQRADAMPLRAPTSDRPATGQGPHDLWGQLRRAIGLFKHTNFYAFHDDYCVMGGWGEQGGSASQRTPRRSPLSWRR